MYTASITLVLLSMLNMKMTIPITIAIPMCTRFLMVTISCSLFPLVPRMSTVKEVVKAVNAEPAAE